MNKALLNIWGWYEENRIDINDITTFILTVLVGNIIKISREQNNPHKWRPSRFISELLLSSLIALTFYQVNNLWLHLPYALTMVLCVWFGSLSTRIYDEMDESLSWIFDTVKTYINNKFLLIIILFSVGITVTGCAIKPVTTSTQNKESIINSSNIKEKETVRNLAIMDSIKFLIATVKTQKPECDSITNVKINELLAQINMQKTSGNNGFGFYYDQLKKQLVAYAKIGETLKEKNNNTYNKNIILREKEKVEIPVKYIPKWVQYLAYLGCAFCVYGAFKIYKNFIV